MYMVTQKNSKVFPPLSMNAFVLACNCLMHFAAKLFCTLKDVCRLKKKSYTRLSKELNTLSSMDGTCWNFIFICVIRFETELNFSLICYAYKNH